jgi:hypothetical protein
LHQETGKIPEGISGTGQMPSIVGSEGVKVWTYLKDFALREELWGHLLAQVGCLGKYFATSSHPDTQSIL